jgi:hypothetical protein
MCTFQFESGVASKCPAQCHFQYDQPVVAASSSRSAGGSGGGGGGISSKIKLDSKSEQRQQFNSRVSGSALGDDVAILEMRDNSRTISRNNDERERKREKEREGERREREWKEKERGRERERERERRELGGIAYLYSGFSLQLFVSCFNFFLAKSYCWQVFSNFSDLLPV